MGRELRRRTGESEPLIKLSKVTIRPHDETVTEAARQRRLTELSLKIA